MPKLFHRGEWYYEIAPTALLEAEFESLLVQNADIIRPGTVIEKFKKTVYSDDGSAQADLAMIRADYKEWVVVEVEMIRHPLYGHVLPQVRTLRDAAYGREEAAYLAGKNPKLNGHLLEEMMRGQPPEVLVLVNKPDTEWERELRRYGVRLMVFEIFRSEMNRYIFSIDGEIPQIADDIITHLTVDRMLTRFVVVGSPAALNVKKGQRLSIFIDDQMTEWERVDIQTSCYLTPMGLMPLSPGRKYALVRTDAGQYCIRDIL